MAADWTLHAANGRKTQRRASPAVSDRRRAVAVPELHIARRVRWLTEIALPFAS